MSLKIDAINEVTLGNGVEIEKVSTPLIITSNLESNFLSVPDLPLDDSSNNIPNVKFLRSNVKDSSFSKNVSYSNSSFLLLKKDSPIDIPYPEIPTPGIILVDLFFCSLNLYLYCISNTGIVYIYDTTTNELVGTVSTGVVPSRIIYSVISKKAFVFGSDFTVKVIDCITNTLIITSISIAVDIGAPLIKAACYIPELDRIYFTRLYDTVPKLGYIDCTNFSISYISVAVPFYPYWEIPIKLNYYRPKVLTTQPFIFGMSRQHLWKYDIANNIIYEADPIYGSYGYIGKSFTITPKYVYTGREYNGGKYLMEFSPEGHFAGHIVTRDAWIDFGRDSFENSDLSKLMYIADIDAIAMLSRTNIAIFSLSKKFIVSDIRFSSSPIALDKQEFIYSSYNRSFYIIGENSVDDSFNGIFIVSM